MSTTISITDWKPRRSGSLRGFVSATLPSGLVINEISVFAKDGKTWASPPSKPMLDRDGKALVDSDGKRRFTPIIEFTSPEIRNRFSDGVIAALREMYPGALDD